jgi:cell division protein FtsX
MSEGDITEIKISTARIEEQMKALTAAMGVQHQNLSKQIESLAGKDAVADIDDRVKKLESAQSWIVKGVVGTAMTAVFAAAGLGKKMGL